MYKKPRLCLYGKSVVFYRIGLIAQRLAEITPLGGGSLCGVFFDKFFEMSAFFLKIFIAVIACGGGGHYAGFAGLCQRNRPVYRVFHIGNGDYI